MKILVGLICLALVSIWVCEAGVPNRPTETGVESEEIQEDFVQWLIGELSKSQTGSEARLDRIIQTINQERNQGRSWSSIITELQTNEQAFNENHPDNEEDPVPNFGGEETNEGDNPTHTGIDEGNNGEETQQEGLLTGWSDWEMSPCSYNCSRKGWRVRWRICNHGHVPQGEAPGECPVGVTCTEDRPPCRQTDQTRHYLCSEVGCSACQVGACSVCPGGGDCCCQNGGTCYRSQHGEDPYGWGWYCLCPGGTGGNLCQHVNACEASPKCPEGDPVYSHNYSSTATRCFVSSNNNLVGRFCY